MYKILCYNKYKRLKKNTCTHLKNINIIRYGNVNVYF